MGYEELRRMPLGEYYRLIEEINIIGAIKETQEDAEQQKTETAEQLKQRIMNDTAIKKK